MKVFVVFDFPEVIDANSDEATNIIEGLEIDLNNFAKDHDYSWYIDDAVGKDSV